LKRVVAILGDYYHSAEIIKDALECALQSLTDSTEICIDYVSVEELPGALHDKPDAVILFKEDRLNPADESAEHWMTDQIADKIARYVAEGGGWLAWHSGLASYPVGSAYTNMLKGYFNYHPPEHQQVRYMGSHPGLIQGAGDVAFEILDEHYFVRCDSEKTDVFLCSESVDGCSVGGWWHAYGSGRVCCLTPAHNCEGLHHPVMLSLLRSAVQWCMGAPTATAPIKKNG
jgi:type 1 glutamine amidotransferase